MGKRIDRNNYDPERVLEIVLDQTDGDSTSVIVDVCELLRLLEESAHAYLMLQGEAKSMWNAIADASDVACDKTLMRRVGIR